jgi:hypothetical protein
MHSAVHRRQQPRRAGLASRGTPKLCRSMRQLQAGTTSRRAAACTQPLTSSEHTCIQHDAGQGPAAVPRPPARRRSQPTGGPTTAHRSSTPWEAHTSPGRLHAPASDAGAAPANAAPACPACTSRPPPHADARPAAAAAAAAVAAHQHRQTQTAASTTPGIVQPYTSIQAPDPGAVPQPESTTATACVDHRRGSGSCVSPGASRLAPHPHAPMRAPSRVLYTWRSARSFIDPSIPAAPPIPHQVS